MTYLGLMGVGDLLRFAATTSAGNPQLQFFENFPGHFGGNVAVAGPNTLSVHAVNIPLNLSFNNAVILVSAQNDPAGTTTASLSISFGLYSLSGSTLSLANSASNLFTYQTRASSWLSMITSATQNITPGTWYWAFNFQTSIINMRFFMNSTINPANAIPGGLLMGRMTVSSAGIPSSIATSELDITGNDAIRQPYIILTA